VGTGRNFGGKSGCQGIGGGPGSGRSISGRQPKIGQHRRQLASPHRQTGASSAVAGFSVAGVSEAASTVSASLGDASDSVPASCRVEHPSASRVQQASGHNGPPTQPRHAEIAAAPSAVANIETRRAADGIVAGKRRVGRGADKTDSSSIIGARDAATSAQSILSPQTAGQSDSSDGFVPGHVQLSALFVARPSASSTMSCPVVGCVETR
jgi:hypothetical protein